MAKVKEKDHGVIRVADITIAQLSRGLYRSNATAFKELVSNAYDADATIVQIDTNFPEFDFISCSDNGAGMLLEEFLRYFKESGIGSCVKRKGGENITSKFKRPIIGRMGIGMLAIGQICHSFNLESHYIDADGNKKAYRAAIVLEDTLIADAEELIYNNDVDNTKLEVGKWSYSQIPYEENKCGFRLYSNDVRKTFLNEMKSSISVQQTKKLSFKLSDLHKRFYNKANKSIRDCKPYLETIWELAILCPLPYYGKIEEYPVNLNTFGKKEKNTRNYKNAVELIQQRQENLLKNNFHAIFDGVDLKRLIQLPTDSNTISKLYYLGYDRKVFKSQLKFSGYIFAQVSSAIRPYELNGIQIRLRNVGIGGYNSTFLKYSEEIETIRSRWVSGEIFVDIGLESALNIDRDSFNEHDEHFKALQTYLHDQLNPIFDELRNMSIGRSEQKREKRDKILKRSLGDIIEQETQGKIKLIQKKLSKHDPIVQMDKRTGEIILNTSRQEVRKKKANNIIGSVMIAYHAVKSMSIDEQEQEERFLRLIKRILNTLV